MHKCLIITTTKHQHKKFIKNETRKIYFNFKLNSCYVAKASTVDCNFTSVGTNQPLMHKYGRWIILSLGLHNISTTFFVKSTITNYILTLIILSLIKIRKSHFSRTCEYKNVPKIAIAAPRALIGCMGVWKIIIEATITEILFIVFPTLNVKGDISSNDIYDTWL